MFLVLDTEMQHIQDVLLNLVSCLSNLLHGDLTLRVYMLSHNH